MKLPVLLIPMLLTLSSCSSPPKPPRVDESHKHPVNAAASVELQVCKGELQNSRILATEKSRD
ncbi:MAG: OmpA family protein, partial [Pseudomonadota bacterium]|nr:OmpA family protein [Pseudomonadota bacterium]